MADEELELKQAFGNWFTDLIMGQETCLYRDVIRDCREPLLEAFMKRRPVWTSKEIEEAEVRAKEMHKALNEGCPECHNPQQCFHERRVLT
jgi:hypothetical protein